MPLSPPFRRSVPLIAAAVVVLSALAGAGCGSGGSSSKTSGSCAAVGRAYTLVAKDVAWNSKCLAVQRGEDVTFTIDNRDDVAHNLHITAAGHQFKTRLQSGPIKQTLKVKVDTAGSYTFVCDIHPNMTGTLRVK